VGEVHVKTEPILRHPGPGGRGPGENREPAGAVLPLDGRLGEEDRRDRGPGGEQPLGALGIVLLQNSDPADELVTREVEAFRHGLDLAEDGPGDLLRHREQDGVSLRARLVAPVEDPLLKQAAPCRFSLSFRYRKAPLSPSHADHQPSIDMESHTIHG